MDATTSCGMAKSSAIDRPSPMAVVVIATRSRLFSARQHGRHPVPECLVDLQLLAQVGDGNDAGGGDLDLVTGAVHVTRMIPGTSCQLGAVPRNRRRRDMSAQRGQDRHATRVKGSSSSPPVRTRIDA